MKMEMLFQQRIVEVLRHSKYTQKQIADKPHISEGNITNWKKGDTLPSIEILFELCKLLDASADYLLGLKD